MEPSHGDIGMPPTISSALAMEQHVHMQQGPGGPSSHIQQQQSPITPQHDGPPLSAGPRKRKKASGDGDEVAPGSSGGGSEPRRLRRSHEACARCRSKKIKCDSKHPRCTACETAGVQCNQEDRHRKTLTPRGHVEKIERQLVLCSALLRRHYPNFVLDDLEHICMREGVELELSPDEIADHFQLQAANGARPFHDGHPHPNAKAFSYPPPPHMLPPGYPMGIPPGYPHPPPGTYPPIPLPPGMYDPRIHPAFQLPPPRPDDIKGQDPQANDLSTDQALAKNFGVNQSIVTEAKLNNVSAGPEIEDDLAVGSGGLISGRDREITETSPPRDTKLWVRFELQHLSAFKEPRNVSVWLPKDKQRLTHIVHIYFQALNFHRPVLLQDKFRSTLEMIYEGRPVLYDPGYICSLYLVLALGTMSELNKAASSEVNNPYESNPKKILPGWIEHEEFFDRALAVKPDLRMTISSLQALILLHWYLYTERQQRSLWRLVGSLVRVAIELGLHHDPFQQGQTFDEEESHLRIRLWSIVMIHDRGTSVLLGRPLAIAPADSSTPQPSRSKLGEFSEHFFLSAPVADIQADIVNALYCPTLHTPESIMRNATRIIKSMVDFRSGLPETYKYFFSGTENWTIQEKRELVDKMTDDQGLTLLKVGIARILLLRAIFSSEKIPFEQRVRALQDAIVVSHNIIVIHHALIKSPDIAFFVSPIPLHIAAMVILFGKMSGCDRIPTETAIEDIWYALDMLPRFRWRWERKDMNGGHPLIEKLAERVLRLSLNEMKAKCANIGGGANGSTPLVLIPEEDWEASSPTLMSPTTPSLTSPKHHSRVGGFPLPGQSSQAQQYSVLGSNGNGPSDGSNGSGGNNNVKVFPQLSATWFWPVDPENPVELPLELMGTPQLQHQPHPGAAVAVATAQAQQQQQQLGHHASASTMGPHGSVPQPPIGVIGCQQSSAYVQEEKDPAVSSEFMVQQLHAAMQQRMGSRPVADGPSTPTYGIP